MFDEYGAAGDPLFERYFGFTEGEVRQLCAVREVRVPSPRVDYVWDPKNKVHAAAAEKLTGEYGPPPSLPSPSLPQRPLGRRPPPVRRRRSPTHPLVVSLMPRRRV